MEQLLFLEKGFDYARKRKKLVFILGAVGFAGYGAYRVYHAPSIARKRNRISKLLGAFVSVAESVSESAETIRVVSADMKDFLHSDSDEIPNSLKQISKLTRSPQFSDSLVSVTRAVTAGVLRGYHQSMNRDQTPDAAGSNLADRVLDKLFTTAGSGFASVVVGSFAKNMVLALYSDGQSSGGVSNSSNAASVGSDSKDGVSTLVDVVCGDKCSELIANCVQLFVSTAVAVYLDKTMHINTYDDLFSGLTNPKHETQVRDMMVSVCNGAIDTLVKTSHQVLTSSAIGDSPSPARNEDMSPSPRDVESKAGNVCDEENESGWVSKVSSTLAIPSNRKLVLDVTGRVTFETVRSFMEFILKAFCATVKRCADIVHEAVVELVRYAAAKSSVIVTICLSLCLHITGGAQALVTA
ncbi:hypothetical protein RIF29_36943 [Crotalaria pallida]|uniref:Protein PHLOEM PROTEIN 2-LIKE A10 n=1 Tax=Crotalaria pallida TaxID=3830 RepID=A0AAN9HUM1_CROPI